MLDAVACVAETRDLACASGLRWLIRYVRQSRAGRQSRTRPHRVAALHAGVVQFAPTLHARALASAGRRSPLPIPLAELRRRLPRLAVAAGEPALRPRQGVHRHGTGADQRYAAQYARLVARLPAIARRRARRRSRHVGATRGRHARLRAMAQRSPARGARPRSCLHHARRGFRRGGGRLKPASDSPHRRTAPFDEGARSRPTPQTSAVDGEARRPLGLPSRSKEAKRTAST